ncbi:MAG TPA: DUF262 domain-containing protein, partial [Vicinamibacterales bacterium]|nr:DUF262 domain-containing protein [Vicinamibacterales bacterium]
EEYFVGSLVLTTEKDKRRPSVVDGQQRLAAVTMILAAIRDYFINNNDSDRSSQIESRYLFTRDLRTQSLEPKLRLNLDDSEFFEGYILERPGSPRRAQTRPRGVSNSRLAAAYQRITDHIAGVARSPTPVDELVEWVDCLSERIKAIVVTVSNEANAFQIFETLNDRGLDLSIADLLKNYVFGQAGPEKLPIVQQEWHKAMAMIGGDSGPEVVTTFLRHFWASKRGLTRERELYQSFKSYIRSSHAAAEFAVELGTAAQHYSALLNSDHDFWAPYGTRTKRHVQTLLMLRMEQYRPLLLAAMSKWSQPEINKTISMLVSWSVRFRIAHQLGSSRLEQFYGSTGMLVREGEINSASELAKHAASTVPTDKEFAASFSTAQVSQNAFARYYLRTLEQRLSLDAGLKEHEVISDEQQVNLEHVLPQRAKREEWPEFGEEDLTASVYRLGNMTLLLATENTKLGNKPYPIKRQAFGQSSLRITKDVAERDPWSPQAIDERQRWLADIAVRAWPSR